MHLSLSLSLFRQSSLLALLLTATPLLQAAPPRKGVDTSTLPAPLSRPVQFFRDVHPLLAEHCTSCHGTEKQRGGLRLDSREAALAGGDTFGPAIIPGSGADSPLVHFTAHLVKDMEMPPKKSPLPDSDVALLLAWVDQGARWPNPKGAADDSDPSVSTLGNQELFFSQASSHWAFQPIPEAASLKDVPAQIDSLIRANLATRGLSPSSIADPRTLLRRLYLDLTGLPPSPQATQDFLRDPSPGAYASLVGSLLASPRFGERWARYWLDLARYADTRDWQAQQDLRYPYAWTYRDYVVDAFNQDKPYPRFLQEQIAADHLGLPPQAPELAALGFLTVGPRFRNSQAEIISDRIDVVTRGVMALTVSCARCHDHKYDPIRADDFYALYGVFASTEDLAELPEITSAATSPDPQARAAYEKALAKERQAIASFLQNLKEEAIAAILKDPVLYMDALYQMEVARTADVRKLITGRKMIEIALTPLGQAWTELKRSPKWQNDPILGPLARVAASREDRKAGFLERMIETGHLPTGNVSIHPAVLAALRSSKPSHEEALLAFYGNLLAQAQTDSANPAHQAVLTTFTGLEGWLDFSPRSVEGASRLLGSGRATLSKLYGAIAEVEATHSGAPPRAMAVQDRPNPVNPVVFLRGDPSNRGPQVDRRFLEVLEPSKSAFSQGSGRPELATHIASRDNPLTPRVWANHVWRHLFGKGLVSTPGDFGLQSQPPALPELLDLLASALMDREGSTKLLIRDIVLSQTYQQSSAAQPEAAAIDPENHHFWRTNRRRLDFESMRDSMLAASGQIDHTAGGRPVDLSAEPFPKRRTIYGRVDRTNLDPLFTTFDFPSPDAASPERSQTMVPQQALFALNDRFIIAQARSLAASTDSSTNPATAVESLYLRVFLRPPSPQEFSIATQFLQDAARSRGLALRGSWLYGYGPVDPQLPPKDRFTRLPHFDPATKRYQPSRVYPHPELSHVHLSAAGGHPGSRPERAAIRRWIAPADGEIAIEGELSLARPEKSDGVRATILASHGGILATWSSAEKPIPTRIEHYPVKKGEVLDFAVDCGKNASSDAFRWAPSIRYLIPAEEVPPGMQTHWDPQAEFSPPPPAPLQPLEQLAHALLMTNEFLFID